MSLLNDIRAKIARREYEFSKHAVDQAIIRDISVVELEQAILNQSEVIEDYRKRSPVFLQRSAVATRESIPIPIPPPTWHILPHSVSYDRNLNVELGKVAILSRQHDLRNNGQGNAS